MAVNEAELISLFPELHFTGKLGEGGEGAVYLAQERESGGMLALKILLKEDSVAVVQFEKEGRLLSAFDHPNIVKVFEYGKRAHYHFLKMEYCSGGTLLQRVAERRFDDREAGELVIEIAKGLQYAHGNKVLHRDIKPENVMMTADDQPKLVDFGLAFCAGEDVHALSAVGSEGYAAPEIWDHPERVSLQTDLYALGALLYTVLTRMIPDPHKVNFNHLFDRERSYVHFIVKAMAKDARRRHSSALEFGDELKKIVGELGHSQSIW